MKQFTTKKVIPDSYSGTAASFLSEQSGLSKGRIKDAMNKGAVWIKKGGGKMKRLRKASARLNAGDRLEMYYDGELLSRTPPGPLCLHKNSHYSVWYKPAGLMSQGTKYGDHCSLLRQAELFFGSGRALFPVHRIDREVPGVVLIAHSRESAARLSAIFQNKEIDKEYEAEVMGNLHDKGDSGTIKLPLDGKAAVTEFDVLSYNRERNSSRIRVHIKTGRYHQIRRHLSMIGHPVMGDPRYGRGNKNSDGIRLSATALRFRCPFRNKRVEFHLEGQKDVPPLL